ncbi:DUF2249 domain-containing protein [Sedimenticola sp.]|uniref:DUF2249 domain-containing protein n=1 Tax=Sedimenticola sp. TaxID=1940285 RepID=UPI003D0FFE58
MEIKLDVSTLEPCEPLERTLAAIEQLDVGDYLRVIHRREPHLLYPLLEKGGYAWRCQNNLSGGYEIFIWKRGDEAALTDVDALSL